MTAETTPQMTDYAALSSSYSRYAARQFQARPELARQVQRLARAPLARAWMAQRLDALLAQALAAQGDAAGANAPADAPAAGDAALKSALRQLRAEVFCTVMARDLAGLASVAEVTNTLSDLAELAIQRALAVLSSELEALYGAPLAQGDNGAPGLPLSLGVVGMGKLGGRELNVSSDIDLIFIYEEEGETAGGKRAALSNQEFFTKLGRRLIGTLAEVTEDGYVFRVDMRLRPNGDAGPLACSIAMLEEYFYVQGREWERYAWIKGRLVSSGDSAAAQRLEAQLEARVVPFIYRRYLDYGVIGAIRSLHRQIRLEAERRARMRPDKADDVKLGRGGIREIEFSAQAFQLIRGGQDAAFRIRPTMQVLALAAERGLLGEAVSAALGEAYLLLRQVEHRLQYMDDAQTHALPVDPHDRQRLAASLGHADFASLLARLDTHRQFVEQQFDQLFSDKAELLDEAAPDSRMPELEWLWSDSLTEGLVDNLNNPGRAAAQQEPAQHGRSAAAAGGAGPQADEAADQASRLDFDTRADAQLGALGFADPASVRERLRMVRASGRYQGLPEVSRQRFDLLVQRALLAACGDDCAARVEAAVFPVAAPDAMLLRFLDLLDTISRRGAYLALLTEYPAALKRILAVLGGSRWAAGYLNSHPQLLDELLDDEVLASPFDWPAFMHELRERLAAADGIEQQMDLLRHAHHAEVFRILLLDLDARLSVEVISDRLSELADAVLEVTLEAVWRSLPRRHCEQPRFAVIAYGKLGGKELGYASDLDIIFLYDDAHELAGELYATFARRLVMWLTTATGAGTLFDIDLRLRPNGASGLLVTSLDAFRQYQLREAGAANTAWVWEHQALSRARFSAGDRQLGAAFEAIRAHVLALPREAATLATEIVAMRARVAEGHPNRSALFDLKHDRGGMVDIEFTVQYLVLLHAGAHPQLLRNAGNITLLRELGRLGLLGQAQAEQIGGAYRTYRALQHKLRLDGMEIARVEPARVSVERAAVLALWQQVFGAQAQALPALP
jgi:glutamate-ammonia-ligase adenylyltransferase